MDRAEIDRRVHTLTEQIDKITGDAEEPSKEQVEQIRKLVRVTQRNLELECEPASAIRLGSSADGDVDVASFGISPSDIWTAIKWGLYKRYLGPRVEEAEKHWKYSTQVHLKIDQLGEYLEKYNLGMGATMLYHCSGTDERAEVSYIINGITKSRFSHATMVMPVPEYPGVPAIWQSAHACDGKLGGGETRNGPDMADLKVMIKAYYKGWPTSRFVFRPLVKPLTAEEEAKALAHKDEVLKEPIDFPSMTNLLLGWAFSNFPNWAWLASVLKLDIGEEVVSDKYKHMFCSMLVTNTLLHSGKLLPPIKAGQFSPAAYGLPLEVGQEEKGGLYGTEYEFIFDDLIVPQ